MKLTYDSRMEHRRGAAEAKDPEPTRYQLRSGGKKRLRREEQDDWNDKLSSSSSSSESSSESSDDDDFFQPIVDNGGANDPPDGDEPVQPDHIEGEVQLEVQPDFDEVEVEDFEITEDAAIPEPQDNEPATPTTGPSHTGSGENQQEEETPAAGELGPVGTHQTPNVTKSITVSNSPTPPSTEWWSKLKPP